MKTGLNLFAFGSAILGANDSETGAMTDSAWSMIGLAAQGVVTLCFIGQLIAFLRTGRIVLPPIAIVLGLVATVVVGGVAFNVSQWILLLAEATNLAAGLQLLAWRRRTVGQAASRRRPGLPVVAPHSADPKSGVVAIPRPGTQSQTK